MKKSFLMVASLGVLATMMSGCQGNNDQAVDRTDMLSDNDRVSNVPWNKPQGWENKSQLGALANDPRIGGQQ